MKWSFLWEFRGLNLLFIEIYTMDVYRLLAFGGLKEINSFFKGNIEVHHETKFPGYSVF